MKPIISSRRVLHQPLVPIQWTPPPPPPSFTYSPLFFPTTTTTTTSSPPPSHHHDSSTTKIVTIVASISIGTFLILSILFLFFHQKGTDQNHHRRHNALAAATAAAAGDGKSEVGSGTARDDEQTVQTELLIHHPISPEIKPLPPLIAGADRRLSPEITPLPPLQREDQDEHVRFFMGKLVALERSYSWSGTTRFSVGSSPNLQLQSPWEADLDDDFEGDFGGKGTAGFMMNSSENVNAWGRFKSRSLRLDDDMIEITTASFGKDRVLRQRQKKNRVLDAEKAESIEILLRTSTVKTEDLCEALLDGGSEFLGTEFLDSLMKLAPTKEEEFLLRHFRGDITRLNAAERFLKPVLDVPFAMKRIEVMLYQARFETNIDYLRNSFQTLQDACQDLRRNKLFLKLLKAANSTINQFYTGTEEHTKTLELDSLLQLCDTKEENGKLTPLHYAVEEMISNQALHSNNDIVREEECKREGLKVMAGLSAEFENVKKAAEMDFHTLKNHVKKQELGLEKVKWLLQLDKACNVGETFFKKMKEFVVEAELEIEDVKEKVEVTLRCIRDTTVQFNLVRDAENPLRIITLVRDFLLVLDEVCKDIRRMHDKAMFGSMSGRILHFSPVPSAVT